MSLWLTSWACQPEWRSRQPPNEERPFLSDRCGWGFREV